MKTRHLLSLLACVLSGPSGSTAAPASQVVVSATAVKDYVRPTDDSGAPAPETYVFAQGQFFGGTSVNHGLQRTTFTDITKILATSLAGQKYYPTTDAKAADLLIMVHWGVTTIYEDPQREFSIAALQEASAAYNAAIDAGTKPDPSDLNYQMSLQDDALAETRRAMEFNATLLGYRRTIEKARRSASLTAEETALVQQLNRERYFVILLAYDNETFNRDGRSKLLWTARISMAATGKSFTTALPLLAQAGSEVYGRHLDNLAVVKTTTHQGEVILGELQVLGEAESTPAPPPEK